MADAATYDAVLVLANIRDLDPQFLGPVVSTAAASTRNRLTVVLVSRYFDAAPEHPDPVGSPSHTALWSDVQKLLTFIYVQATTVAQGLDRVLMDVEVLLKGFETGLSDDLAAGVEICYRLEGGGYRAPTGRTNYC
jgi:pantetheine-phosphate adenylyltransferase